MKRALGVAVLSFLVLGSSASAYAQDSEVAEYSGSGIQNTRPFTVSGPWEVSWDARGDLFQLYIHDEVGNLVGVAANQMGVGDGSSYQPTAGIYYLQVNAIGSWTVTISQVSDAASTGGADGGTIHLSGSGAQNTRPFTRSGPWEIQWRAEGDLFQLFLHDENGSLEGVPSNQMGAGTGSSYQPRGGTYYLQVNALGNWEMDIVDVE